MLNDDILEHEVEAALKAIRNNKSAGLEGVQGEYYKYALHMREGVAQPDNVLAPLLCVMFNKIFCGDYPEIFTTTTLCPVLKKGDPTRCDNYRGIAVGGALSKLYASVQATRITEYCDDNNLRAASQAGCRKGFGTEAPDRQAY